jgi:TolA-binding protein
LQYSLKEYDDAYNSFIRLETIASTPEIRQSARIGAMRCSFILSNYNETINIADRLLSNQNLSPELNQEALYHRATAYTAIGDSVAAHKDYIQLANDTRSVYGAEGAYRSAQYLFNQGNINEAEEAANKFVKNGSPHAYWLARTFILLADINNAKGETYIAEQYLLQLQESYPGENDDIQSIIEDKLQNLQPLS